MTMKNKLISIGVVLLFCAFTKGLVIRKHDTFVDVAKYLLSNKMKQLKKEDINDSRIKKMMKELKIDVATDGNQGYQYNHEPKDSVVVFINHGSYLFGKHKRVFYDYAKNPRHFIDTTIVHNGYKFKKVSDRFYISSQKTDR